MNKRKSSVEQNVKFKQEKMQELRKCFDTNSK